MLTSTHLCVYNYVSLGLHSVWHKAAKCMSCFVEVYFECMAIGGVSISMLVVKVFNLWIIH